MQSLLEGPMQLPSQVSSSSENFNQSLIGDGFEIVSASKNSLNQSSLKEQLVLTLNSQNRQSSPGLSSQNLIHEGFQNISSEGRPQGQHCSEDKKIERQTNNEIYNINLALEQEIHNQNPQKVIKKNHPTNSFHFSEFSIKQPEIGKGGQGIVYQAESKFYERCAIKAINLQRYDRKQIQKMKKQTASHVVLQHQNILKTEQFFLYNQGKQLVTVLEYCQDGDLRRYMKKIKNNPDRQKQIDNIIEQIKAGLDYLHSKGICHRDIKLQNILMKDGVVKITDLGLAILLELKHPIEYKKIREKGKCGTSYYMSPELIRHRRFTMQSDLWALGIVILELLTGERINKLVDKPPGLITQVFPSEQIISKIQCPIYQQQLKVMLSNDPNQRLMFYQSKKQQGQNNTDDQAFIDLRKELDDISKQQLIEMLQKNISFPECSSIDLYNKLINDQSLRIIAVNGHLFPQLVKIDLCYNKITNQGVKRWLINRDLFNKLLSIDLGHNKISDEGFIIFCESCKDFPYLKEVDFCSNSITDEGFQTFIAKGNNFSNLQKVNLGSNIITGEKLKKNTINGDQFIQLRQMDISNNQITGIGFKNLVEMCKVFPLLYQAEYSYNKITDEGLNSLGQNGYLFKNLETIYFNSNQITYQGLKKLTKNGHNFAMLKRFYIQGIKINSEEVNFLNNQSIKFNFYV